MEANRQKYFDPRVLARLKGLVLRARQIVEGYMTGLHRSPYRGFSIEFAEHREYAPGDDLRYLDWKVFGRTDKFYLKQFEAETNLVCYLVVDASRSMSYQSAQAPWSKWEYAQALAAALAYLVLAQQDSVGLVTFDHQVRNIVRPGAHPSHLKEILTGLEQIQPEGKTSIAPVLDELAERFVRRGLVVILSDFFDQPEQLVRTLAHFRHRRHDVILMQVLDRAEEEFPFEQLTRFEGLEEPHQVVADARSLRAAYLRHFQAAVRQLQRSCREHGMEYVRLHTDRPVDVALRTFLSRRKVK
ncbi:MAG: DUF58 domain-containing protein [Thermoguttaceae bacterium]|nr:DUF58 domain-containing protein [Thermoguttaceae bacterium]MDW8039135.1 DUF58 domain-containing protein [Thermoguttaceae bacterium]